MKIILSLLVLAGGIMGLVITCPALNVYLAIDSSVEAEMGGCNYNLKLLNHIL